VKGRPQIAVVLAVFGVILLQLAAPPRALGCTGAPLTLDEIGRAAQSVVLVEVIEVGPPHAVGVPASFTLRVDQVLAGSAPALIQMTWPTLIDICDGYIATLGDRFYMATGVGPYSPIWPLRIGHPSGAERSDLPELLVALAKRPQIETLNPFPVVFVVLLLGASLFGGVAFWNRRRG